MRYAHFFFISLCTIINSKLSQAQFIPIVHAIQFIRFFFRTKLILLLSDEQQHFIWMWCVFVFHKQNLKKEMNKNKEWDGKKSREKRNRYFINISFLFLLSCLVYFVLLFVLCYSWVTLSHTIHSLFLSISPIRNSQSGFVEVTELTDRRCEWEKCCDYQIPIWFYVFLSFCLCYTHSYTHTQAGRQAFGSFLLILCCLECSM